MLPWKPLNIIEIYWLGYFFFIKVNWFQSKPLSLVNLYYIHVHILYTRLINIDTSSYANKTKKKKERNKGDSDWLTLSTFKIWMFRSCLDCVKSLHFHFISKETLLHNSKEIAFIEICRIKNNPEIPTFKKLHSSGNYRQKKL